MYYDACIIGGAGRVGLPLGVVMANSGIKTVLFDINTEALNKIEKGTFPFKEKNGDEELRKAQSEKMLFIAHTPDIISESKYVVVIIGTPLDRYLNPDFSCLLNLFNEYFSYFLDNQIIILRSTVYPGTSEKVSRFFADRGKKVKIAFCPERIVEGRAIEEIKNLPQIVSAFDQEVFKDLEFLFSQITNKEIVRLSPLEAELAKLFSNSWRYIKFASANQFYMIAKEYGLDYLQINQAMKIGYERNKDLPSPGFAAGPCLLKDTMQLAAFNKNNFFLGHSAMLINEGLPNFIIQRLKQQVDLASKTVGILGMAFKAESDDLRDSLAVKLRKILELESKQVLCHDFYVNNPDFLNLDDLLNRSDIIILAAPHAQYRQIDTAKYPFKTFIDIWGFWQSGKKEENENKKADINQSQPLAMEIALSKNPAKLSSELTPAAGKKVLVTGSAGFVGGYLVEELLNHGYEVVGIDNYSKYGKTTKSYDNHPHYHFTEGDVKNTDLMKSLIQDCDQVIALAAMIGGISYFHTLAYDLLAENERIIASTFDAAVWAYKNSNLKKINVISSSMVFESASVFPTPEGEQLRCPPPLSTYGFQKLACEYYAKGAYEQYQLPYTIIRPFNCVGIGEKRALNDKEIYSGNVKLAMSHVVPDLVQKVVKGQDPLHILGEGNQIRHYTYGGDLAKGIRICLEKKEAINQDFNLSTPESTTVLKLAQMIWEKINPGKPFNYISDEPFKYDVQKRMPAVVKAKNLLDFTAETSLSEMLDEVIPWIKKQIELGNI